MKKNIHKRFEAKTTLKEFIEELKKDGCVEIVCIWPNIDDNGYDVSFNIDLPRSEYVA